MILGSVLLNFSYCYHETTYLLPYYRSGILNLQNPNNFLIIQNLSKKVPKYYTFSIVIKYYLDNVDVNI